jgi:hypothetical protein
MLARYDSHFDCADYANQRGEQVYARSIPYLTIDGADAGENAVGVPEEAGSVSSEDKHSGMVTLCKGSDPPGVLYRSMRVSATFRDDSDLTWFPFDMQALSIGFRLWGSNVPDETDEGRVGHHEAILLRSTTRSNDACMREEHGVLTDAPFCSSIRVDPSSAQRADGPPTCSP